MCGIFQENEMMLMHMHDISADLYVRTWASFVSIIGIVRRTSTSRTNGLKMLQLAHITASALMSFDAP